MNENTGLLNYEELAEKERLRILSKNRSKRYITKNKEKKRIRDREYNRNGRKPVHIPGRKRQMLKNGKTRYCSVETKYTKEIGEIILHLTLMGHPIDLIAKAIGITRITIQNWKNENHNSYVEDFSQKYDIAYRNSTEVLFSFIKIVMDDTKGDMYADNKTGTTVMRPNNANVQRSKLILDKLFRMIRIRQSTISRFGRETMVVWIRQFCNRPTEEEEIKEANLNNNQSGSQKQITG